MVQYKLQVTVALIVPLHGRLQHQELVEPPARVRRHVLERHRAVHRRVDRGVAPGHAHNHRHLLEDALSPGRDRLLDGVLTRGHAPPVLVAVEVGVVLLADFNRDLHRLVVRPHDPHRECAVGPLRGAPPEHDRVPLFELDRPEAPVLGHGEELALVEDLIREVDRVPWARAMATPRT